MVACHQCGKDIRAGKKFCGSCGAQVSFPSFAQPENKKVCQKCGNRVKVQDKICALCGTGLPELSAQSEKQLSAGNRPMPRISARWPVGWEPPPIGKLMPPPPPLIGNVFRLSEAAPYLNAVRGISSARGWGRALLTLAVGMFILPFFDLRLLGEAQPGIAFLVGIISVILMVGGRAARRKQAYSIAPGQQTSHFSSQAQTMPPPSMAPRKPQRPTDLPE